ncbi:MAG: ATP-binding cassette domain-containing protein [Bernardetiaceae bacterium]|nr:ATP-binding cassette domain-containing protein [Bernardetiaceae bacterium]
MENPVVKVKNLTLKHKNHTILNDVNFQVGAQEFVYLIGKTGSGKSSILRTLYADLPFEQGDIEVAGVDLKNIKPTDLHLLRRQLGIIFQDFQLFSDRNIYENLAFVMRATGWTDIIEIQKRIYNRLSLVGLEHSLYRYPLQLSGGEQQRIAIARALLNEPKVIFADEPTGNLDPSVADEILALFTRINQEGTAVLMATHNHSFLKKQPARVLYCEEGQVKDLDREFVIEKMSS